MQYRADIDGLRALAIIPVVLYHADFQLFSGGYVGVDVFFVISGYLITLIISREMMEGRFTLAGFYERRVRRIFPALFAVMLFCLVVSSVFMHPEYFKDFGKSIIATALFVANFFFWQESDYFAAAAETKPLLHTWSLSVEEQFYIFFPVLLLFIYKYFHGRWKIILLPAALISLIVSMYGVNYFPSATFYLIPMRAWELLLGALLALGLFSQPKNQQVREAASIVGLLLIAWSIFMFTDVTPFPGGYALFPCVGAALIIYSGENGSSIAGRLLSLRPIVFVGLISYSLYLWHWPLIVFAKQIFYEKHSLFTTAGIVVLSFVMATLSWKYVEHPFRKRGTLRQRRRIFVVAASVMMVSIILGYTIRSSDGWPARFGDDLVAFKYDLAKYNINTCFLRDDQEFSEWKGESCFLQTTKKTNKLLWGASFAAHYIPGIRDVVGLIDSNVLQYTAGACAPAFNYDPKSVVNCKSFAAHVESIISDYDIHTIVMSAGWALALKNGLSYAGLKETVELLRNKGIKVILIGQSPRFDRSVQDISNQYSIYGIQSSEDSISINLDEINSNLKAIAGADNFADPSKLFCDKQECRFKSTEGFYFWDDGHMTDYGSKLATEYIFSRIKI